MRVIRSVGNRAVLCYDPERVLRSHPFVVASPTIIRHRPDRAARRSAISCALNAQAPRPHPRTGGCPARSRAAKREAGREGIGGVCPYAEEMEVGTRGRSGLKVERVVRY